MSGESHLQPFVTSSSSNNLSSLSALCELPHLRAVNASSNQITSLSQLPSGLERLSLAYNRIASLTTLNELPKLIYLDLAGNSISDPLDLKTLSTACPVLQDLTLTRSGASNPACNHSGYHTFVLSTLPSLVSLDNIDRDGAAVPHQASVLDGSLAPYLNVVCEDKQQPRSVVIIHRETEQPVRLVEKEPSPEATPRLPTPRIDAVLKARSQRHSPPSEVAQPDVPQPSPPSEQKEAEPPKHHHNRPSRIPVPKSRRRRHRSPSPSISTSVSSMSDIGDQHRRREEQRFSQRLDRERLYVAHRLHELEDMRVALERERRTHQDALNAKTVEIDRLSTALAGERDRMVHEREALAAQLVAERTRASNEADRRSQVERETETWRQRHDRAGSDLADVQETVTARDKALAEAQLLIHKSSTENQRMREVVVKAEDGLRRLKNEVERLREREKDLIASKKHAEDSAKQAKQAEMAREKETQEVAKVAAAAEREADVCRQQAQLMQDKVLRLQETIAMREEDHRKEAEASLNGHVREMRALLAKEAEEADRRRSEGVESVSEVKRQAAESRAQLEDEFRIALREHDREMQTLQAAYQDIARSEAQLKQLLHVSVQRETRATAESQELKALLDEHRARLLAMERERVAATQELELRVKDAEDAVARQRETMKAAMTRQESQAGEVGQLRDAVAARDSAISQLRSEARRQEEALKEATEALQSERGRGEGRWSQLTDEVARLAGEVERLEGVVRHKDEEARLRDVVVRDLSDSLSNSKRLQSQAKEDAETRISASERRVEAIQRQQREEVEISQKLQGQLASQAKIVKTLERLIEKEKSAGAKMEAQYEEAKRALSEKDEALKFAETEVADVKRLFEERERKTLAIVQSENESRGNQVEKLKSELDVARDRIREVEHECGLLQVVADRQKMDADDAKKKVLSCEEEMRVLLHEMDTRQREHDVRMGRLREFVG